MRATGIVRRIDDLGRIVIPREIRQGLSIKEGDPLEIFTDDDGVILKPYHADAPERIVATAGAKVISALKEISRTETEYEDDQSDDVDLAIKILDKIVQTFGE